MKTQKKFFIDIAPGYGDYRTASLTDGEHGCTVTAEDMGAAIAAVRARAALEKWPKGEAMITEIDHLGRRVEGKFCNFPKRIAINV